MATLHGGQVLRQYCNKRSRKREAECVNKDEEEKDKSSMITTMPDSHHSSPCEPMKSKSPDKTISLTSQPQVIVRKFTLPALNSSHFNLSDRTKRNPNFAKPKQRWKQLCNLQHEMTTTLPVSKVKVLSSSPQLTREFRPGTLQSYPSGKLDIMSSTLHQLLTSNTTGLDSTPNAKAGKPKHLASPLQKSPSSSHKTPSSTFKSASSPPVKSSSSPVVKSVSSSVKSVSSPVKSTTVSSPAVKSVSSSIKSVSSPPVKSATVSSPSIKSVSPPPIESMPSSPVKSMSFLPIKSMSSPPVQSASSPPIQSVPSPPVITTTSPVFPVLKTTTVPPTEDPEVSKDDCVNVEQMLDTAEEVPYVAAVAEVSSSSGTIRLGPFDTSNNDIGIVGGKIVIFQQLQGNKLDAGNDKVGTLVVQNNQSAAVDAKSGKIIIGPFVGQKEPIKSVLKNTLIHGSSKINSEASGKEINDSMQEDLKQLPKEQTGSIIHNSESSIKEQVELQGISKCNPNVPTKKQNVIWGNAKLNSERFRKEEINDAVATKCNSEMTSDNQKIIQRSVKLTEVEKKEQTVTQGNLKHELESTHKEQKTGTQGNLKNNSEVVNNGHVLTAHSLFSDPNLQKANRENFQEVINRLKAVISAQKGTEQIKNYESGDKLAGDVSMESLKKPLTSQQLQHQIALMKARQSIALQVEREVLRAKERSLVQEVNLPARKVFVAETSTQTSLFSLVEPGRMVEMLINTDKNGEY
ncbi:hypothetical protein ANN_06421 [Periplaneta americana]|uniref:Uncharacterized protein n=1 Tax=Periplaneta americana TaxID=6978 RepID=A0ABQ8TDP0_PERAM|nr:hypothetical protein ANN_06421 [Periplaneta americana]